jgi:hypothetical protein
VNDSDFISLKYYLEQTLHNWQVAHSALHEVELRERIGLSDNMDRRLNSINEIRERLNAQVGIFLAQDVYNARHSDLQRQLDALTDKVGKVGENLASLTGRGTAIAAGIALVASFIGAFVGHALPH